jgi:tRNA U34 2-thiouridine synthase MnmA/TrmU
MAPKILAIISPSIDSTYAKSVLVEKGYEVISITEVDLSMKVQLAGVTELNAERIARKLLTTAHKWGITDIYVNVDSNVLYALLHVGAVMPQHFKEFTGSNKSLGTKTLSWKKVY